MMVCPSCFEILEPAADSCPTCPKCGWSFTGSGAATRTRSAIHAISPADSDSAVVLEESPDELPETVASSERIIGRYRLIRELGGGGHGAVYLAEDMQLERQVAIKMPKSDVVRDTASLARFVREGRNAAQLHHPAVVAVHDVGEHEGVPYLVCEYVDGETLAQRLKRTRPSYEQSAGFVAEIAEALDYAHSKGVIHRDVKGANIMIDRVGRARLMDFGLAKREGGDLTVTRDGSILGTIPFMSPEQTKSPVKLDGKSDQYSLGVVLYQLLARTLPFHGSSHELIRQICESVPRRPRSIDRTIPLDLETICLKAMEKETSRRYSTAQAMADDLFRWLRREPIKARPVGKIEQVARWARRNPVVASLSTMIAVLLVTIAAAAFLTSLRERALRRHIEAALLGTNRALARNYVENGARSLDQDNPRNSVDVLATLPWFAAALATNEGDAAHEEIDRIRLACALRAGPKLERMWFHEATVERIRLSPDRKLLLSTSKDSTARVWNVDTDEAVSPVLRHSGSVIEGNFSPDGKSVVTSSLDGTVRVWDIASGKQLVPPLRLDAHVGEAKPTHYVLTVQVSPNGKSILTAGTDGSVRLWSFRDGTLRPNPVQHRSQANYAEFNLTGNMIVTASADGTCRVVDGETTKPIASLTGERDAVFLRSHFSPDGERVASADEFHGTVHVWFARSGERVCPPLRHGRGVGLAAFSPDGKILATATLAKLLGSPNGGMLRLWRAESGEAIGDGIPLPSVATSLTYSSNGAVLLVSCVEGTVRFFEVPTGRPYAFPLQHNQAVTCATFTEDDRILTACADGCVRLWNAELRRADPALPLEGGVDSAALSPDGRWLAAGLTSQSRTAAVLDVSQYPKLRIQSRFEGHESTIRGIAWTADGSKIATGSMDSVVAVWNPKTGQLLQTFRASGPAYSLAFSPNDKFLVVRPAANSTTVWDVAGNKPAYEPLDHGEIIEQVALDAEAKYLATVGGTNVRLWHLSTGKPQGTPLIHEARVQRATFCGGDRLVAVTNSGDAFLWDVETHQVIARINHGGTLRCAVYSPIGRSFATTSWNGTARVWNAADGSPLSPFMRHSNPVSFAEFNREGNLLVTVSEDQAVRVWNPANGTIVMPPYVGRRSPWEADSRDHSGRNRQEIVGAFFDPTGRHVFCCFNDRSVARLSLLPTSESRAELSRKAAVLSGFEIDSSGGKIVVGRGQLAEFWSALRQ